MNELSLFTGVGGGIYGSLILGWNTLAYVEKEPFCRKVIAQRIKDGWFDNGEIYGDIKEFNEQHAKKYSGKIDVLTGGFPCQPFSVAGQRKGRSDDRYLFDQIIKTIEIIRPKRLFFENVPGLLRDPAIIEIYRELKSINYDVKRPLLLGSDDCGNIHRRKRVWIFADNRGCVSSCEIQRRKPTTNASCVARDKKKNNSNSQSIKCNGIESKTRIGDQSRSRQSRDEIRKTFGRKFNEISELFGRPDIPEPLLCRMDDEIPNWRYRLKAIGNGQDPIVMATAYKILEKLEY